MRKALVLLALLFSALPLLGEEPLANEDVVKMVAAGLGEELVIAKVRQAREVKFLLEVDDLVALRTAGVGEKVDQAMLARSSGSPWSESAPVPDPANPWTSMQEDLGIELVKVALSSSEGTRPIAILRGEMSSAGFMGMGATFMNYPGLRAQVRTSDRRPTLLVKSSAPLAGGRYFLAKLDPDTDDEVRSLKISSMKAGMKAVFGGNTSRLAEPDPDWVLAYDSVEESPGLWRVTLKADLPPGEYGWYVDFGTGAQAAGLFGFGVD